MLGEAPTVDPSARIAASSLGRFTEIGAGCILNEVTLGDYSYMVRGGEAWAARIGKFVNIAAYARINATNHPMQRASLHHFTYRAANYWPDADMEEGFFDWRREHGVTIGHDAWIGHGAIIMPGVTIGDGAVIGSGSVVTKDVGPYEIAVGAPARIIRRRFEPAIADRMQALAWWDWSHAALRSALPDFRALSAQAFLEKYEPLS